MCGDVHPHTSFFSGVHPTLDHYIFLQKLTEWGLREVADHIEIFDGETLAWDLNLLGISEKAWNRTHHRGIKPVLVFSHPQILQIIPRAVSYYRMLAMVSQKSMNKIKLPVGRFESGRGLPTEIQALYLQCWGFKNKRLSTLPFIPIVPRLLHRLRPSPPTSDKSGVNTI